LIRTFDHADFPPAELLRVKSQTVSAVLPARDEAATIGPIVRALRSLGELVDQILVIDADSEDGTAAAAAAEGAEVHSQSELLPELGAVLGKGDAMWRALSVASGDLVVYLDSDTIGFPPHFASGLLGPLLTRSDVRLVKGAFRRPYIGRGLVEPDEGGRVTELCARPLLAAFHPPLAAVRQPLAGEFAAPRALLEGLPFATGYGVDIGILIDVYEAYGAGAIVQVDLGERRNEHQPLLDLGPMAYTVLGAVLRRLHGDGRLMDGELLPYRRPDGHVVDVDMVERPPFATLRAASR
jgi:glucosyl-3-phosphoglycerate synthase